MHQISSKAVQVSELENGKGVQYLLNEGYAIFGNPILIHDMEYRAIDYNKGISTDDPIWNEYTSTGTVGISWLDFFKNECFIEAAANTKKITFLISDKLKYDRIYGKIFNKNNIQIGCAVMMASGKPFEQDDPLIFENFCDVLSVELGNEDFYIEYGQAYFEKLVYELIAGISDIALYAAHVESIYMHLKTNIYLAVADIGKSGLTKAKLSYFRDLFRKTQPEFTYAVYSDYILIIISTENSKLNVEKDLPLLNELFCENNIYGGISESFENLFDLNKYYEQALSALNKDRENSNLHIALFE